MGFPIRRSTGQWICAPYRSFSQLVTSFFGSQCQGIHPALFLLNRSDSPSSVRASGFSMVLSIFLHNIKMLLRCLPIQRFILSNKSFLFGIRFLWCFSLSPYDSTSFEGVAPSFLLSFFILKVMPGSHLLSRSLAPQYYRPAVSLPSCSGWERVFLTAASPPDNYFFDPLFICFCFSTNKVLTHRPLLFP